MMRTGTTFLEFLIRLILLGLLCACDATHLFANIWTVEFPIKNDKKDGFLKTSPVGSFPSSVLGLFDMGGKVWEWTSSRVSKEASSQEYVIKGGSYLCSSNYCEGYRIGMSMSSTPDSAMEHLRFRTVKDL